MGAVGTVLAICSGVSGITRILVTIRRGQIGKAGHRSPGNVGDMRRENSNNAMGTALPLKKPAHAGRGTLSVNCRRKPAIARQGCVIHRATQWRTWLPRRFIAMSVVAHVLS